MLAPAVFEEFNRSGIRIVSANIRFAAAVFSIFDEHLKTIQDFTREPSKAPYSMLFKVRHSNASRLSQLLTARQLGQDSLNNLM